MRVRRLCPPSLPNPLANTRHERVTAIDRQVTDLWAMDVCNALTARHHLRCLRRRVG